MQIDTTLNIVVGNVLEKTSCEKSWQPVSSDCETASNTQWLLFQIFNFTSNKSIKNKTECLWSGRIHRYCQHLLHTSKLDISVTLSPVINVFQTKSYIFLIPTVIILDLCCQWSNVNNGFQHFLEALAPFEGLKDNEISNYLYNKSLEVEPRGCKTVPRLVSHWPWYFFNLMKAH